MRKALIIVAVLPVAVCLSSCLIERPFEEEPPEPPPVVIDTTTIVDTVEVVIPIP